MTPTISSAWVELIAALAIAQYLVFVFLTGRARGRSQLKAPAVSGDAHFERMFRVQMNTLELLVAFLPLLILAARHWPASWVCALGVLYLVGRLVYWRAYIRDPSQRGIGFGLSVAPVSALAGLELIGLLPLLLPAT